VRLSRRADVDAAVVVVAAVVGVFVVVLVVAGADCAPQVGIAEAADCCDCLGDFAPDGADASFSRGNCLPTLEGVPNLGISDERQVCAEAAGQSLNGNRSVDVIAACLQDGHPCADVCDRAAAVGVTFDPQAG
jgi:hypothetical protein